MVLDAALLSTQNYKVGIKGKVEQSREGSSALLYTSVLCSFWKGKLRVPFDNGRQLSFFTYLLIGFYLAVNYQIDKT